MDHETQQNNELAALTDALLEGRAMTISDDLQDLAAVVRSLHRTIGNTSQPGAAFHTRLTQRLNDEWSQVQREHRIIQIPNRRLLRSAMAVAALLVVVIGIGIVLQSDTGGDTQTGTAAGDNNLAILIGAAIAVVGLAAFYYWLQQRRKN